MAELDRDVLAEAFVTRHETGTTAVSIAHEPSRRALRRAVRRAQASGCCPLSSASSRCLRSS
ncbi:MAG TPA: hypothetical protein VIX82_18220, partial [Solirubrobacteraceae bacterium]